MSVAVVLLGQPVVACAACLKFFCRVALRLRGEEPRRPLAEFCVSFLIHHVLSGIEARSRDPSCELTVRARAWACKELSAEVRGRNNRAEGVHGQYEMRCVWLRRGQSLVPGGPPPPLAAARLSHAPQRRDPILLPFSWFWSVVDQPFPPPVSFVVCVCFLLSLVFTARRAWVSHRPHLPLLRRCCCSKPSAVASSAGVSWARDTRAPGDPGVADFLCFSFGYCVQVCVVSAGSTTLCGPLRFSFRSSHHCSRRPRITSEPRMCRTADAVRLLSRAQEGRKSHGWPPFP